MAIGIIQRLKEATQALAGLMSAADKAKLDGIESGATNTPTPVDDLTSESTTAPLSANQGRVLRRLYDGSEVSDNQIQLTGYGITFNISKYGRVCTVSANTGSVSDGETIPKDTAIITLPVGYRPVSWLPVPPQNPEMSFFFAINASGAITTNIALPAGTYVRFYATFITL